MQNNPNDILEERKSCVMDWWGQGARGKCTVYPSRGVKTVEGDRLIHVYLSIWKLSNS